MPVPLEVTQFTVDPDNNQADIRVTGPGFSSQRIVSLDALPTAKRRLLDSVTTTLERIAWEHFRARLQAPGAQRGVQVFISYRSPHAEFAEAVARRLGQEGVVPWLDKWEVLAGDSIVGKIEEGLRESEAFILILTADFQAGRWATEELESAISRRIETGYKIIPILLEACERPDLIRQLRYVDFSAHDPDIFEAKMAEVIDGIYGLSLNPFRLRHEGAGSSQ